MTDAPASQFSHPSHGRTTRRRFLAGVAASSAAIAAPGIIPAAAMGADGATAPSERLALALIGHGMMGRGHWRRLVGDPAIQAVAVCDVDRVRREAGRQLADETYPGRGCAAVNDYREVLGRRDVDGVVIATPDHWHTLVSIHAAEAGKDVYCEKPISITVREGRELADTMRRHGRVFQTGTQYRSIPAIRRVCHFVRSGGLGKVKSAFALWTNLAGYLRWPQFQPFVRGMKAEDLAHWHVPIEFPLPGEPVPDGLDWELWVGPGAWRPYNPAYHRNPMPGVVPWAFCDGFGVASITWHQSHSADVIQYALGMETSGPVEIIHPSTGEFPTLTCRYSNGTLLHMVEHWGIVKSAYGAVPDSARLAGNFGGVFVGERGWMTSMTGGGPVEGGPESVFREMKWNTREVVVGANNHHANWFECIRTRRRPSSHEEIGHRSASLGHLITIAYTLRRSLKWDPVKEEFLGDDEANRFRHRPWREPWHA